MDRLWAAVSTSGQQKNDLKHESNKLRKSRAAKAMIWTKQIKSSLSWINFFLEEILGPITRTWDLKSFLAHPDTLIMIVDASPWGMGGILLDAGIPIAWYSTEVTAEDENIHQQRRGDHKGQQVWEALSILIAMNLWSSIWLPRKMTLTIRGDNKAA